MRLNRLFYIAALLVAHLWVTETKFAQATERNPDRRLIIGDESRSLKFYGHINRGLLSYDDGRERANYFVDNKHSESRFGLTAAARIRDDWTIIGNYEAQYDPYSTAYVNQVTRGTVNWSNAYLLRKLELSAKNPAFGQIWIGQGHMASDGVSERDLSGTSLAGSSDARRLAQAQFLQFSDTLALSDIEISDGFDNLDGLSRKLRARYDTPRFQGFGIESSVGTEVVPERDHITAWDIVVDYQNEFGSYEFDGALAFSRPDSDTNRINGSFSVLHSLSGISLTTAVGTDFIDGKNPNYIYGKVGYQFQRFNIGLTALSIDAYSGRNFNSDSSESFSVGFQSVQKIDRLRTELFLGIRYYEFDDLVADYKSSTGLLTGARIKF